MTIKQVLEDAAAGARFDWAWTERKPGILFLDSNARGAFNNVHEVYSLDDAVKLNVRIEKAGGTVDYDSLIRADAAHCYFIAMRDGTHPDAQRAAA